MLGLEHAHEQPVGGVDQADLAGASVADPEGVGRDKGEGNQAGLREVGVKQGRLRYEPTLPRFRQPTARSCERW